MIRFNSSKKNIEFLQISNNKFYNIKYNFFVKSYGKIFAVPNIVDDKEFQKIFKFFNSSVEQEIKKKLKKYTIISNFELEDLFNLIKNSTGTFYFKDNNDILCMKNNETKKIYIFDKYNFKNVDYNFFIKLNNKILAIYYPKIDSYTDTIDFFENTKKQITQEEYEKEINRFVKYNIN